MLLNFSDHLTSENIKTIVKASIENDQIFNSWGARRNLKGLFLKYKEEISPEERTKIKQLMGVIIPD